MNVKMTRKRAREVDLTDCTDCFPLSKRINSLTINNSNLPLGVSPDGYFQCNVHVDSQNMISNWNSPPDFSSENITPSGYIQYPNSLNCDNINQHNCHTSFDQSTINHHNHHQQQPHQELYSSSDQNQQSWVSSLKYSHDNMESEYYVNNRLLFDLYIERISRTGQQPANPY